MYICNSAYFDLISCIISMLQSSFNREGQPPGFFIDFLSVNSSSHTMPKRNRYLEKMIPKLYQRQTLDVMVFTFIDCYKLIFPSVTLKEAATAFLKHYEISEDLYDLGCVMITYNRVNKDLFNVQKEPAK